MTVYFTASVVGKRYHLKKYETIVVWLKTHNYQPISEHILKATEDKIRLETKAQREAFHARLHEWITSCNCVIVEASFPSISVGYEISLALHWNKPVLILYSEGDPPSLLNSYKEDKIICEKYTMETLPEILRSFLTYVSGQEIGRFTFFLPTFLAAYLEARAQKTQLSKAAYLRKLLEKDQQAHP